MRTALSLLFLLFAAVGAQAQTVNCNSVYQVSQAATALTTVVSGDATGKSISICGVSLNAGGATATAQLEYGTGTNCATGTTAVTPAISLGINGVFVDHTSVASLTLPRNTDLCLVTTGTGPMQVLVYYGQF